MRITALTCTGDRPEAFALCEKYMARQTLKPFQWIVVCDGKTPTKCNMGQEFYYRPNYVGPESLKNKVREVVTSRMVKGDALQFFEDDDFFDPRWLEFCAEKLEKYDMIGEGRAIYHNIRGRYWNRHDNMNHASLCSTAIRTSMLAAVSASCSNPNRWIDDMLWQKPHLIKKVFDPLHTNSGKPLTVGIKGMPGRVGYSWQHVRRPIEASDDLDLEYLRYLIGDDAKFYESFYQPNEKPI